MRILLILLLLTSVIFVSCEKSDQIFTPKADFGVDSTILFINDTARFINLCEEIDNGADTPVFQWYFQGGIPETSNSVAPKVTYPNPGSFLVKLLVKNRNGQDSIIKPDFIKIYGMFAGKLEGIDVIHKVYSLSNEPFDSIDINKDGIFDIQFIHYSSCCRYRNEEIYVKCLNKTQISRPENSFEAKKHTEGELISPVLFWSSGTFCLSGISQVMQGDGTTTYGKCGEFNSENQVGFICFRINNEIYGWINLSVYTSFFGSYLGIRDYAYSAINQ